MQDATTHANWVGQLKAFHLEDNAPTTSGLVFAKMIAPKGATKIKRKARPRSKGQNAAAKAMQDLIELVYGDTPLNHAEGSWTAAASDFLRKNPKILDKHLGMQKHVKKVSAARPPLPSCPPAVATAALSASTLTRTTPLRMQVMGSTAYMPSPCVFVCPFYHESKCGENGKFRLNGPCVVSQLYSHWQSQHKARWPRAYREIRPRAWRNPSTCAVAHRTTRQRSCLRSAGERP